MLKCTPEAFAAAAKAAQAAGAKFPLEAGETLDALLARLEPLFFDPTVDPIVTNKTPGAGQGHPGRERQQPVRRRDDGGPRGLQGALSRSTRGW